MKTFLARLLPDWLMIRWYVSAGAVFGEALSYVGIAGPCIDFEKMFYRWKFWEEEYSRRGYRTVSDEVFYRYGFGSIPIAEFNKQLWRKRVNGEEAVLYTASVHARLVQQDWFRG